MLKWGGQEHNPAGIAATKPGSLAVECLAFTHDGCNLSQNWRWIPIAIALVFQLDIGQHTDFFFSWIYTHYLIMDTNFHLKLHNHHIKNDPELGPEWAYCVDKNPYQDEMYQYGDQVEVQLIYVLIIAYF